MAGVDTGAVPSYDRGTAGRRAPCPHESANGSLAPRVAEYRTAVDRVGPRTKKI